MPGLLEQPLGSPLVLHTGRAWEMSPADFFDLCALNPELRLERSAEGDILIMAPESGSSGSGNMELGWRVKTWTWERKLGSVFGPSTGFILPNGATRSPDVAWVSDERLATLADEDWEKFLPLCPDFVIELLSPTDSLRALKEKMQEYVDNGTRLGWLIDPFKKSVHIYRPGTPVELVQDPSSISAEPILPGFELNLPEFWSQMERPRRNPGP